MCYLNQCNASQRQKLLLFATKSQKLLLFATKKGSVKNSFLIQQFAKKDVHMEYIHNIDQAALRKDELCCQSLLRPHSWPARVLVAPVVHSSRPVLRKPSTNPDWRHSSTGWKCRLLFFEPWSELFADVLVVMVFLTHRDFRHDIEVHIRLWNLKARKMRIWNEYETSEYETSLL